MSVKFSIKWAMGHETLGHMNVLRESNRRHCPFWIWKPAAPGLGLQIAASEQTLNKIWKDWLHLSY